MEQVTTKREQPETDNMCELSAMSSYDMNMTDMEEMEPIESPAFIWGKWNFVGS